MNTVVAAAFVIVVAGCSGSSSGSGEDGGIDGAPGDEQSDAPGGGSTDAAGDGPSDGAITMGSCATPTFSPASGTYPVQTGFTVVINDATFGAKIHYTTDNTDPNQTSPVYVAPIAIAQSTTIKAYCTAVLLSDSPIATADYVLR